ncbi:MAG: MerR family transcriptional regulator [Fibrobacteraceae bacterium]
MRYGQIKTEKIYWSITEVSTLAGIPAHVLRYWEKVIPDLQVPKNRAGNRSYRKQEVEFIKALAALLAHENIPIAEAGERLKDKSLTPPAETLPTHFIEHPQAIIAVAPLAPLTPEFASSTTAPSGKTHDPEVLKRLRTELLEAMARLKSSQKKGL